MKANKPFQQTCHIETLQNDKQNVNGSFNDYMASGRFNYYSCGMALFSCYYSLAIDPNAGDAGKLKN